MSSIQVVYGSSSGGASSGAQYEIQFSDGAGGFDSSPSLTTDASGNLITPAIQANVSGGLDINANNFRLNTSAGGLLVTYNLSGFKLLRTAAVSGTSFQYDSAVTDASVETAGFYINNKNVTTKDIVSFQSNSVEVAKIDKDGKMFNDGVWFSGTLGGTATADTFIYEASSQFITAQADQGFQLNIGASRWVDISQRGLPPALRLGVVGVYEGVIQGGDHAGLSYKSRIDDANNLVAHNFVNDVPIPVGSDFMKWTNDTLGANTDFLVMDENGDMTLSGELLFRKPLVNISATLTLDATNHIVNCTANTFTVDLPTAVGIQGKEYIIKNSGAGTITVDGDAAETIDGVATVALLQYESVTVVSDNTNWIIV